ncbi:MAG: hypothetical protein ACKUBY_04190 [Candidatus Moraniibacteriota bacterium]
MRVAIHVNSDGWQRVINHIVEDLEPAVMPKTISEMEYVAVIDLDRVNIFWVTIDAELVHYSEGIRNIGSMDIRDSDIVTSTWNLIQEYWEREFLVVDKNRSLMYARQKKISNF